LIFRKKKKKKPDEKGHKEKRKDGPCPEKILPSTLVLGRRGRPFQKKGNSPRRGVKRGTKAKNCLGQKNRSSSNEEGLARQKKHGSAKLREKSSEEKNVTREKSRKKKNSGFCSIVWGQLARGTNKRFAEKKRAQKTATEVMEKGFLGGEPKEGGEFVPNSEKKKKRAQKESPEKRIPEKTDGFSNVKKRKSARRGQRKALIGPSVKRKKKLKKRKKKRGK